MTMRLYWVSFSSGSGHRDAPAIKKQQNVSSVDYGIEFNSGPSCRHPTDPSGYLPQQPQCRRI